MSMTLEPEKPETGETSAETHGHSSDAPSGPDREPTWGEGTFDPSFLEAAKRVFERRRDLLRRLA